VAAGDAFTARPIGFVRSALREKAEAPRQGVVAGEATLELLPEFTQGLTHIDGFERLWLVFWFHLVEGPPRSWMVLPPRSTHKRGVFATRSPHRPNPIGLTAARLLRREGRKLFLAEVDLVDGTPVLDVKPYLAYADAFPQARAGWLDEERAQADALHGPSAATGPQPEGATRDPLPLWDVAFGPEAERALQWLSARGVDLREPLGRLLALGPQPHPYRRIKPDGDALLFAHKEWRARFTVQGRTLRVEQLRSGYRAQALREEQGPALDLHRAFEAEFQ
jgi:tRNA-Thr(GGU) m(6)t(6)A37 methyltransferase TsaA